jgi:hypothetical protein
MGRLALPEAQRPQRYIRKEGNVAYSSGNSPFLPIGQTAYLTSLDLVSVATVLTLGTGTATLGAAGTAFGALGNVQVKVNGGRAPFSLPGYHTDVFTRVWDQDYGSDLNTGSTVAASSAATTLTFATFLRVPVTIDPISERGAFYAGDTALNLALVTTFNPVTAFVSGLGTGSNTFAGSYDVWSEKFEAPQPDQSTTPATGAWLDKISYYCQTELYGTFPLANGTVNINMETDQDFIRVILIFYTGSLNAATFAPADALYTTISLKINDVASIWDVVSEARMRFEMDLTYTNKLPAGTCVLDFMRIRPPSRRDILPTDPNIAKRVTLQIASTSSSNNVDVITQTSTDDPFAQKWVQLAAAQAKKVG